VFVKHVDVVGGAVPVTVICVDASTPSGPTAHVTVPPPTVQPGVDVATFEMPAGIVSWTVAPELGPGPMFVTVIVHVTCAFGSTVAGTDLAIVTSGGRLIASVWSSTSPESASPAGSATSAGVAA
jgi:hypothetical protein